MVAGALIGFNREERGHSAGLRTTMLVCMAASLSMIQVNLLLGMSGKTYYSFAVMDLMRLPLGILSGMGFIGAGAILRKDTLVTGVTTAATLWFSTMMGLCFGGGQIGLGLAALIIGLGILQGLKAFERCLHKPQEGTLTLEMEGKDFSRDEIKARIIAGHGEVRHWVDCTFDKEGRQKQTCLVTLDRRTDLIGPPPFLEALAQLPSVARIEWKITGPGSS
ncbi:MAG TPA: MgtC/SapB family protein [Chthoniobacteraceae bacterium]|nr:MgtC/SapB family protein [Chthoniobacteraceae bacterium]